MNYEKHVEMTESTAIDIAERFFDALKAIFKILPLKFSCEDLYGEIIVECDEHTTKITNLTSTDSENNSDLAYKFFYNNRIFKIEVAQNEDIYGYFSCLPSIDRETYVFCSITEYRKEDGKERATMDFAFDIEKRTFVELFLIEHYNKQGLVRECQMVNYIESILSGKEII